jgi:hypothetical protein
MSFSKDYFVSCLEAWDDSKSPSLSILGVGNNAPVPLLRFKISDWNKIALSIANLFRNWMTIGLNWVDNEIRNSSRLFDYEETYRRLGSNDQAPADTLAFLIEDYNNFHAKLKFGECKALVFTAWCPMIGNKAKPSLITGRCCDASAFVTDFIHPDELRLMIKIALYEVSKDNGSTFQYSTRVIKGWPVEPTYQIRANSVPQY